MAQQHETRRHAPAPDKKFAAVAACDIGGETGAKACGDAVAFFIGKCFTQPYGDE